MKFIGIIPARYKSTRFPGKPLVEINGVSMIERAYNQSIKNRNLINVVVATDDYRIYDHASNFGEVVMTKDSHKTGTERCLEALNIINKI